MQRGARITLAAAILLAGATAAMLFRRDNPSRESAHSVEPAPLKSLSSDTPPPAPVMSHLAGRIEYSDHIRPEAGSTEVPPSPLAVVPSAAALPQQNHYFTDEQSGQSSELPQTHKVRDGDTLSELARRYLGRRERFMEIFEANRDKLASPDLLPIGKELRIPPAGQGSSWHLTAAPSDATSPPQSPDPTELNPEPAASLGAIRPINGPIRPPRTYRVQNEETLVQVAERVYGNAARYRDLYDANRDRLDSPQNLRPGMILLVP